MMGKAGAEKRPSQSLALHCSDRCALQKEKDKDKCTIYTGTKTGEYKDRFTIHYEETKRNIQGQEYTQYTAYKNIKQRQINNTWLQKKCLQRQVHNKLYTKTGIIQRQMNNTWLQKR